MRWIDFEEERVENPCDCMNNVPDRDVAVFTELVSLPVQERAVFLDRACAGDEAFRKRIEALLQAHEMAGDFLGNSPAGAVLEGQAPSALANPGDRIDRYKLLQQIGEGGCGIVYMAEQEVPVRRLVALKVIKPGMDTKSVIARFEAERQALALMDHPNIAKVFDAGATDTGRPYFVMELVRGIKITQYCDQQAMPTAERLELFVQVCHAVQHAHQKGIIHRDIKPSNILVTATAEGRALPKIIDFGIAKATTSQRLTDKTLYTAFEMLIGTPAYMSPEQAALTSVDVDTRTDIYSLGVLLYELLTGTTPFDVSELLKEGLDEIRRVILNREPVRPSTRLSTMLSADLTTAAQHRQAEAPKLIRMMRGDLDWIVLKALEKDRTRRYHTASGLAEDVRHFLANEAVLARPPSTWYRFQKLAVRNKFWFGGALVIATMLVAGLGIVTVLLTKEKTARREADAARQQAEADKISARTEASRSAQMRLFLEDMLAGIEPSVALGRDTILLREILDKTADRLDKELTNQPAIEADLRYRIGNTYLEIGEYKPAESMLRKALDIRVKLLGEENIGVADAMNDLGNAVAMQQTTPEAENLIRRALAMRQKLLGDHVKVTDSFVLLAMFLWRENRLTEAEAALRQALAMRRGLLGDNHPGLSEPMVGLGSVLFTQAKYHEAELIFRQALEISQKELGEEHPGVNDALHSLAVVMSAQGNFKEAEASLRKVLAVRRKLYGDEDTRSNATLRSLAASLLHQKKYAEAEKEFRHALAVERKLGGPTHLNVIHILQTLSAIVMAQGRPAEVDQLVADSAIQDSLRTPQGLGLLRERGHSLARRGLWKQAEADMKAVLEREPENHDNYHLLAPLLVQTENPAAYQQLCRQILERFGDTKDPYIADRMAKDCLILPSPDVDLEVVRRMTETAVTVGKNEMSLPFFQVCKALGEYRLGSFTNAVEWAQKAAKSPFEYSAAEAYAVMAMAHFRLKQHDAARAALAEGTAVAETRIPKVEGGDIGSDWRDWIIVHALMAEARALIETGAQDQPR